MPTTNKHNLTSGRKEDSNFFPSLFLAGDVEKKEFPKQAGSE